MTVQLLHGNCKELLKTLPDCSVDSIVTDPPYELGFMGKSWDSTGIAYDPELWGECLRVLKHGGHLLSFSGSRTYHRMAVAIEDAGFQIRDQIMWVYGSGFPKSLDISKAIDKAAGAKRQMAGDIVSDLLGTRFETKLNIDRRGDGTTLGLGHSGSVVSDIAVSDEAQQWSGWGTALKPAHEPIVLARKPLDGTVANNVLIHGVGGINIDGCRVDMGDEYDSTKIQRQQKSSGTMDFGASGLVGKEIATYKSGGRFPANFIHDGSDEVLELMPNTDSGSAARFFYCAKAGKAERNLGLDTLPTVRASAMGYERGLGDAGGGVSKGRNPQEQNSHPTVKPLALMRYLVRMVTPPNGTVLEPFAGSGTTLMACVFEGFDAIGMEMTAEYLPIIEGRVAWAEQQVRSAQPSLFEP